MFEVCGLSGMKYGFSSAMGVGGRNATEKREDILFLWITHCPPAASLKAHTHTHTQGEINEDVLDLSAVQLAFICCVLPLCLGLGRRSGKERRHCAVSISTLTHHPEIKLVIINFLFRDGEV